MQWIDCSKAFHQDGSLRDLYVHDTTIEDWDAFLAFLQLSSYSTEYYMDATKAALPNNASIWFADGDHVHNLTILVGESRLNCHFFAMEEIELDLDPREVTSQEQLDAVLDFMVSLGFALQRDVVLTEENCPEHFWFRFVALSGKLTFIEAN